MSGDAPSLRTRASLLIKLPPFEEEAINAEFEDEYLELEARGKALDLRFQDLTRDLRIWISSSINPLSVEAKAK